jgi:hypothetical protein
MGVFEIFIITIVIYDKSGPIPELIWQFDCVASRVSTG